MRLRSASMRLASNQKVPNTHTLNNGLVKVKVENSIDLILDYGLKPLYKSKFMN